MLLAFKAVRILLQSACQRAPPCHHASHSVTDVLITHMSPNLVVITRHMTGFSWAQDGRFMSALRQGPETNMLMGSIGLLFALLLWATSQVRVCPWVVG